MAFDTQISFMDRAGGQRHSPRNCALARSLGRQWGGQWTVGLLASVDQFGDVYNHGWRGYLTVLCYDYRLPPVTRTVGLRKMTGARARVARYRVARRARKLSAGLPQRQRSRALVVRGLVVPAGAVVSWMILPDLLRVLAIITAAVAASVAIYRHQTRRSSGGRVISQASTVHRPELTARPIDRRIVEPTGAFYRRHGYVRVADPLALLRPDWTPSGPAPEPDEPVKIPPPEPVPGLPVAAPAVRRVTSEPVTEKITP
jgi:hypothetical protein